MFDYTEIADTAASVLSEYGTLATIGTGATQRTALVVMETVVSHALADSQIQIGDYKYIVEASANPVAGERLTVGSDKMVIVSPVIPVKPADVVVCWYIYGRRG